MRPTAKLNRNYEIIRRYHEGGESFQRIADAFDISYGRVSDIMREYREKIFQREQNGESLKEIADNCGISEPVIAKIIQREALRDKESRARNEEMEAARAASFDEYYNECTDREYTAAKEGIYEAFRSGMSIDELSEDYMLSHETVLRLIEDSLVSIVCKIEADLTAALQFVKENLAMIDRTER